MNPARAKTVGRLTENLVVQYLRSWGLKVERRRLAGVKDCGDIAGWDSPNGSVCVEVKTAGGGWRIPDWARQLDVEADNAAAETGVIIARPKGKTNGDDFFAILRLPLYMELMQQAGYVPAEPAPALITRGVEVLDAALLRLRADAVANREKGAVRIDPGVAKWQTP